MENKSFKPKPSQSKEKYLDPKKFDPRYSHNDALSSMEESYTPSIDSDSFEDEEEIYERDWDGLYSQDEIDDQEYGKEPLPQPEMLEYDYNIPEPRDDHEYTRHVRRINLRRNLEEESKRLFQQQLHDPSNILSIEHELDFNKDKFEMDEHEGAPKNFYARNFEKFKKLFKQ